MPFHVLHHPDHPDCGGRVDGATVGFVKEADVAADDRRSEDFAGLGHPLDALGELVVAVRLLGAAEVEAIGDGDGLGPDAREVPVRLRDRRGPASSRVEKAVAAPAIGGNGEAQLRALDPHDRRVGAGQDDGVRADLVVILGEDRSPRTQVRMPEHPQKHGVVIIRLGNIVHVQIPYLVEVLWTDDVALVDGGVGEVFGGDGADYFSVVDHAQVAVVRDAADDGPHELIAFRER